MNSLLGDVETLNVPGVHFVSSPESFYSQMVMDILAHACALEGKKVGVSENHHIPKYEWYGDRVPEYSIARSQNLFDHHTLRAGYGGLDIFFAESTNLKSMTTDSEPAFTTKGIAALDDMAVEIGLPVYLSYSSKYISLETEFFILSRLHRNFIVNTLEHQGDDVRVRSLLSRQGKQSISGAEMTDIYYSESAHTLTLEKDQWQERILT